MPVFLEVVEHILGEDSLNETHAKIKKIKSSDEDQYYIVNVSVST